MPTTTYKQFNLQDNGKIIQPSVKVTCYPNTYPGALKNKAYWIEIRDKEYGVGDEIGLCFSDDKDALIKLVNDLNSQLNALIAKEDNMSE